MSATLKEKWEAEVEGMSEGEKAFHAHATGTIEKATDEEIASLQSFIATLTVVGLPLAECIAACLEHLQSLRLYRESGLLSTTGEIIVGMVRDDGIMGLVSAVSSAFAAKDASSLLRGGVKL